MDTSEMKTILDEYIVKINEALPEYLPDANDGQRDVVRAMRYCINNGGKRLRPVLTLAFCKMCGGTAEQAMPFACAVEFVHTYSLIHDDLPCMDNDDLRRGKPTCHRVYGEATALLAGDALLTHAFEAVASSGVPNRFIVAATALLAQNAGVGGMIGGQVLDLLYENKEEPTLDNIVTVHKLKTGALISAACLLGCIAAGADDAQMAAASRFAYTLGVAFQIKDDILDVTGDEKKLGKPIGSDAENEKTTYVSLVGIEKAQQDVANLTEKAIGYLKAFDDTEFTAALAEYLISREK